MGTVEPMASVTSGRRTALACGLATAVAACGTGGTAKSPDEFTHREVLTSCGTFTTDSLELTTGQRSMVECILQAATDGDPKELDFRRPGTDCCELRYVIRVLGPGNVEMFTATDDEQWTLSQCTSAGLTGEPFGFPEAKGCAEPQSL